MLPELPYPPRRCGAILPFGVVGRSYDAGRGPQRCLESHTRQLLAGRSLQEAATSPLAHHRSTAASTSSAMTTCVRAICTPFLSHCTSDTVKGKLLGDLRLPRGKIRWDEPVALERRASLNGRPLSGQRCRFECPDRSTATQKRPTGGWIVSTKEHGPYMRKSFYRWHGPWALMRWSSRGSLSAALNRLLSWAALSVAGQCSALRRGPSRISVMESR